MGKYYRDTVCSRILDEITRIYGECATQYDMCYLYGRLVRNIEWHALQVYFMQNIKNTLLVITFELIIIDTSDWHQNVSNSTHYHTGRSHFIMVQWPFQALEVNILGQGHFSKMINSYPILLKFCTQVCRLRHTWKSMSIGLFFNQWHQHSYHHSIEYTLFFLHLFHLVECMVHHKFGKIGVRSMSQKIQTHFSQKWA
jgi:hypothetical protein